MTLGAEVVNSRAPVFESAAEDSYPRRYGVVSLLELLRFTANDWTQIIRDLRWLGQLHPDIDLFTVITQGDRARLVEPLERIAASCAVLGLTLTEKYARELIETVQGKPSLNEMAEAFLADISKESRLAEALKPQWFADQIAALQKRFDDELGLREFYAIPAGRREYFATPYLFGVKVSESFPAAAIDIEEAGKCFALGRWTACVMHLMRAMEFPVQALAHRLGVRYEFRGWDAVIKKMRVELEKSYDDMDAALKGKKEFFGHALDRLTGVKDALRNPTMHARVHYDPDRAEEAYRAVRSFMQLLADELTEVES